MADIRRLVDDVLQRAEDNPNIVNTPGEPVEANGNTQIAQPQEPVEAPREVTPPTEPPPGSPEFTAKGVFDGAEPRVVHSDDGSAEVTAGKVATPSGPAEATVRIDRDRRGASAEMVLPDGGRVESRRTSPDGRTWSQIDTIRDPQGTVVGTQTTGFDGTRLTQTWAPADGPAQTVSHEAKKPSGDVHLASDEAVLGLGAFGALATLSAAPLVAGAIVLGLGVYAASKAYDHFAAPDGLEDQSKGVISKAVPPKEQPEIAPKEGWPDGLEEEIRDKTKILEPVKIKDLKKIGKGEIKTLEKGGFNVHDEKDDSRSGPVDLYKDRHGNIYQGRQDGQGEADPLGDNINNYR